MQNPEEDKLKRLLQDTFSDYEPEPSEQTWEYIDASIHPHQPFAAKFAKRLAVAAIALLLLISAGVIFMLEQNSQKSDFQVSLLEKNKDYTQHKKSRLAITKEASILKKESQNSHSIPSKNNPVFESSSYSHHQKRFQQNNSFRHNLQELKEIRILILVYLHHLQQVQKHLTILPSKIIFQRLLKRLNWESRLIKSSL
jgi:apolipoprotein N-acyltransferase